MRRLLVLFVALIVTVADVSVAEDLPMTRDALRLYNEKIREARALQAQGTQAIEKKDYHLAITHLTKALEVWPNNGKIYKDDLYATRAAAYRAINEHGKAAEDVKAIIGIYNEIEAEFSETIRMSPKDHYAYWRRSLLHAGKARLSVTKQQQSEYEMAVADITAAIRLVPNSADYYGYRSAYYHALGNSVEAERDHATSQELRDKK